MPRYASQRRNVTHTFSGYSPPPFPFANGWALDAKAPRKCCLGQAVGLAIGGERMFLRFHGQNHSTAETKRQAIIFAPIAFNLLRPMFLCGNMVELDQRNSEGIMETLIGTKVRTLYQYSSTGVIVKPIKKINGTLPMDWHIIQYDDGGRGCIHRSMFTQVNEAR